jgi:hypothetical protein
MPDAERDLIARWDAAGAPLGEPHPARPAPAGDGPLGPPTHAFPMAADYRPPPTGEDDYRCFVIDPGLTETVPVSAISVAPGNLQMVHHATVFLLPPSSLASVRALDAADGAPGYECFGGVGVAGAVPAGAWVPGYAPPAPPRPGLGGWIPPGWPLVLQAHYNFAHGRDRDRSSVVAWRSPQPISEVPASLMLGDWTIDLPAGQAEITRSVTGDVIARAQAPGQAPGSTPALGQVAEGLIYAVWGHEHLLGRSFRMELVHADGAAQCLLHIPRWDFHWQSVYTLKTPVAARAGEHVRVTCSWDNSDAHQPLVGGQRAAAREVRYGEGTGDEMCIGSLAVMGF